MALMLFAHIMMFMKNVLILNGSMGGRTGNTSMLLNKIRRIILKSDYDVRVKMVHLAPSFIWNNVKRAIKKSDALIFASGTYWDS